MHPDHNQERHQAQAKFLVEQYGDDFRARYVDAADYGNGRYAMATINACMGHATQAASACCNNATAAEELAIALAMTDAGTATLSSVILNKPSTTSQEDASTHKPPALQSEQKSRQGYARN